MFPRVLALAHNTFREAARDRVPLSLFAAGIGVGITSLLVAAMSLGRDRAEVVAALTCASISLFSLVGAVVLGATLLHKDLDRKTIFPILARPVRRHEVIVGKHLGIAATISTFALLDGALALTLTAITREERLVGRTLGGWLLVLVAGAIVLYRARDRSTPLLVLAPVAFLVQVALVGPLGDLRTLVLTTVVLSIVEATLVAAVSMVFGAFSSPALAAALTVGIVLIGRNADMLAKLPEKTFGHTLVVAGRALARVVPNLHIYVPPRVVATGRVGSLGGYLGEACAYGAGYALLMLALSAFLFRRRDFT